MTCMVCQRPYSTRGLMCNLCGDSYRKDEIRRPDGAGSQYGIIRWAAERAIRFERRHVREASKP